jgi:hypothetical protein
VTLGPIIEDQREMMNGIARALDQGFNGDARGKDRKVAFVLLTAPFNTTDGRVNYISNGERSDIITMMKELLARFEGRYDEKGGRA